MDISRTNNAIQGKAKIFVVDDVQEALTILRLLLLRSGYEVFAFNNSIEAYEVAALNPPDMFLLDVNMPEINGYELCCMLKRVPGLKEIPVIFLSGLNTPEHKIRGFEVGGVDYIVKPYSFEEVQARVKTHIRLRQAEALLRQQNELLEMTVLERTAELQNDIEERKLVEIELARQIETTKEAFNNTIYTLARAAEVNDEDTGNHILRVGEFAAILAMRLHLDSDFVEAIRLQAILHDVGKLHAHPDIFKKSGKLTEEEFVKMKGHTQAGAKIIGNDNKLSIGYKIALTHHEKWDGSGYPAGLRGEQIPIEGRITALADIYDALRSLRTYKDGFDHDATISIITEGDGRTKPEHFDPAVLKAFKETSGLFEEAYKKLQG